MELIGSGTQGVPSGEVQWAFSMGAGPLPPLRILTWDPCQVAFMVALASLPSGVSGERQQLLGTSLFSNCSKEFLEFTPSCQLMDRTCLSMGQSPLYLRGNGITAKEELPCLLRFSFTAHFMGLKPSTASHSNENTIKIFILTWETCVT